MLMNALLTYPSILVASTTSLSLRPPLGERVMSVHCQRLARFNLLPHNEYFAELNVVQREFRVKSVSEKHRWTLFAQSLEAIVE